MSTVNQATWERLIDEDIAWLDQQPDTLECKHIRQCLEWLKHHKPTKGEK
jgi:Golgi nucleoside diphosphatase